MREKVRDETLEVMLQDYKPMYRFLKEAEYEPKMKVYGTFQVPLNWFFDGQGKFNHFTDVERVFCYNQLTYILLAESFERGHIPDVPKIPLHEFYKMQKDGSFTVECNDIRYNKPIVSTESFEGKLEIVDSFLKSNGGIIFFDMAYDFENGKATGIMRTAWMLRDLKKGF